ncbi:MAG: YicC/YloC family endoribonuclease [Phycisphaerae bacterium]
MTGFGSAAKSQDGTAYTLEIRSLNNRYFKASIKLPEPLQFLEPDIERALRSVLRRGSVNYTLRIRSEGPITGLDINTAALEQYLQRICSAKVPDGVSATIDLAAVSAMPGVCQPPEADDSQREQQRHIVTDLTDHALDGLVAMRRAEGQVLRQELLGQCERLVEHLEAINERAPQVTTEYHQKLRARVEDLTAQARLELDADALTREVALFADRCDITEEIVRLRSHLEQFEGLCDSGPHIGRKMDFLAQEMLRESNTIGSKSNDAQIARAVIEIKAVIDRLKEQVQNVE